MTTTFEAAITIVEQLSPSEQARLVVLLTERLQRAVQTGPVPDADDEPAFWMMPADDVSEVTPQVAHLLGPKSAASAQAETQTMLAGWFGAQLREEDALELAMSESLGEWDLEE
jgi:hypothetical protein